MRLPVVLLLFAASGAAGLIYQVCWVRLFGVLLGNTVQSAAVVSGSFLAALGTGAWLGGRLIDRAPRRPLRAYGLAEVGIALWGLGLALALPQLSLAPSWSLGPEGWFWPDDLTQRVGLSLLCVAPPAALMGATLAILGRALLGAQPGAAGWHMGLLMAANTGGAALGAVATDLWLVPWVGVLGTQGLAIALGLGAGLIALGLPEASASPPVPTASPALARAPPMAGVLCLAGFAAMGLEVLWFRFLGSSLGQFRVVFGQTLGMVLIGLWAGALVAGLSQRRGLDPRKVLGWAQLWLVFAAFLGLLQHDPDRVLALQLSWSPLLANLITIAPVVLPASIALGMGLPLASAAALPPQRRLGAGLGLLVGAGALGNLLGALTTGFVLIPALGMQTSLGVLLSAAALAALLAFPPRGRGWALAALLPIVALVGLSPGRLLAASFPAGRLQAEGVLAMAEGIEQTVVVTGTEGGPARLWTSGHPMSSTTAHAQRYMRFMAHLPLLMQPQPERALVICFGVGNTAHAAGLHPSIQALDIADLSPSVLGMAPHFAHANHGVLSDPRTRVIVDDGRRVLRDPGPGYGLITLEPPPIGHAGVAALYSTEFYALARERLSPGGVLSQWLPAYQVSTEASLAAVAAFAQVFPDAVMFVADRRELVLLGRAAGGAPVRLADLQARMDARPAVAADLQALGFADAAALVDRFGGSSLDQVTAGVAPVSDDHPILEHDQASARTRTRMPATLFDPRTIPDWCSDCPTPAHTYDNAAFLEFDNAP